MKLIIAIVNSDDANKVQGALTKNGFFVTKLSTSGGFLKKGNVTFFVGTEEEKVEKALSIIQANSKKRIAKDYATASNEIGDFFNPVAIDVIVGGATVFVLDVEQFEKF